MKLNSTILGILILAVIFGGVFGSASLGWWRTTGRRIPANFRSGPFEGAPNPADIRGSYALEDIYDAFDIPVATLARAFALPVDETTSAFKVKDLEERYADIESELEVGTDSVRWFVAWYAGLPYEPGLSTAMPRQAANILQNQSENGIANRGEALSSAQIELLQTRIVELPTLEIHLTPGASPQTGPELGQPGQDEDHLTDDQMLVRGKTTFADLLDWGLSQQTIEAIIGAPMPNRLTLVRDHCTANGLSFGQIKVELQAEVDKLAE
ncbi:hypothetical protein ACFLZW_01600 [Chloroflexota bacterium]